MGMINCCAHSKHHKLPQSDISDETNSSEEVDEDGYSQFEIKDQSDLENREYNMLLYQSPSKHFLFKQKNYMEWYTDDVAFRHTYDLINEIKKRYLECDNKSLRCGMNRYLEIDPQRGHLIASLSPYFKNTTIFECSKRFATALNERFPANKYKSNNIRVIEDKLFDYFAPKQDLMPSEYSDGFSMIMLHCILNVVQLKKWDVLLRYLLEIMNDRNDDNGGQGSGSLLVMTCLAEDSILMNIIQNYIPHYRTHSYIMEQIKNLIGKDDDNIVIDAWADITKLMYMESMAIEIYMEMLEIMFAIYDNTLFGKVKNEIEKTLTSMLIIDGYYSDKRDAKTGEYTVTVELSEIHIAVRKN